jgi:D-3-phosphoglycerate dehydrogenase
VIEVAHDAAAIVAQYATISAHVIAALPHCRVIARYGTGVDIVDVDAASSHDILVTNVPSDWCENEVADHAMALLLGAARKITVYDRATRDGVWRWQSGEPIHRLRGRVLGLLSFGSIAKAIAARAAAFGMSITTHDPYLSVEDITAAGARAVSFDELVTESDCLHPSPQRGLDRGGGARRHRGGAGQGAGLAAGQPPLRLGNVIITPHAAYYSKEAIDAVRHFAAEEVVRVLSGQAPLSPVNAGELVDARWSRSR